MSLEQFLGSIQGVLVAPQTYLTSQGCLVFVLSSTTLLWVDPTVETYRTVVWDYGWMQMVVSRNLCIPQGVSWEGSVVRIETSRGRIWIDLSDRRCFWVNNVFSYPVIRDSPVLSDISGRDETHPLAVAAIRKGPAWSRSSPALVLWRKHLEAWEDLTRTPGPCREAKNRYVEETYQAWLRAASPSPSSEVVPMSVN